QEDAYPFALSSAALEKLRFVHDTIVGNAKSGQPNAEVAKSAQSTQKISRGIAEIAKNSSGNLLRTLRALCDLCVRLRSQRARKVRRSRRGIAEIAKNSSGDLLRSAVQEASRSISRKIRSSRVDSCSVVSCSRKRST